MAQYNKGGGGSDFLGAKDLVGDHIWAVYAHALENVETNRGPARALRAEVYELTEGGAAVRHGSALFFQTVLLKLPLEEWSVGIMVGPDEDQSYYDFPYPGEAFDELIDAAMADLPEHPELPEGDEPDKPARPKPKPKPPAVESNDGESYYYEEDEPV